MQRGQQSRMGPGDRVKTQDTRSVHGIQKLDAGKGGTHPATYARLSQNGSQLSGNFLKITFVKRRVQQLVFQCSVFKLKL